MNILKHTPPVFTHFIRPTGSRRYAPTLSRMYSAAKFVQSLPSNIAVTPLNNAQPWRLFSISRL